MFAPGIDKHVNVILGANTAGFNAAMAGATSALSKFNLGAVAATTAVAALALAIEFKAVKGAAAFEQAMARVQAVTQANAEQFRALGAEAQELGKTTKFSMVDIAQGMESLGRAGFRTQEIIDAMSGVTALASSQLMGLAESGQIAAQILRAMQLPAEQTNRVVNLLAQTAATSNTTVESLGESFKMIAPLASTLGVSVEQLAALIGELGNFGYQGTLATTTLATALTRLADPPAEATAALKKLNVALWDQQGNFVGFIELVRQLEDAFEGLTQQQKTMYLGQIFGARSVKQIASLVSAGADAFEKYTEEVTGTTAAFDQQARMLDTLSGKWVIFTSSVDALFQALGEGQTGPLGKLVVAITDVVNMMAQWVRQNNETQAAIKATGDAAQEAETKVRSLDDSITDLTGGTVNLQGAVYGTMNAIKLIWDATFGAISSAINMLISALMSVIALLSGNWTAAWDSAKRVFGSFAGYFIKLGNDMGVAFHDFIQDIKDWWSGLWTGLKRDMTAFVNFFISGINTMIDLLNKIPFVNIGEMAYLIAPTAPGETTTQNSAVLGALAALRAAQLALQNLPTGAPTGAPGEAPTGGITTTTEADHWPALQSVLSQLLPSLSALTASVIGLARVIASDSVVSFSKLGEAAGLLGQGLIAGAAEAFVAGGGLELVSAGLSVLGSVVGLVTDTFQKVNEGLDKIASNLQRAASVAADFARSLLGAIQQTQLYQKAQSFVSSLLGKLFNWLSPLDTIFGEILGAWDETSSQMQQVGQAASEAADALSSLNVPQDWALRERLRYKAATKPATLSQAEEETQDAMDELQNTAEETNTILEQFGEEIAALVAKFKWVKDKFDAVADALMPSIVKASITVLDHFADLLAGVADRLLLHADVFSDAIEALGDVLAGAIDALAPVVYTAIDALAWFASFFTNTLSPILSSFFSSFKTWWEDDMDPFIKNEALPLLGKILADIATEAKKLWDVLSPHLVPLFEKFATLLDEAWQSIKPMIDEFVDWIDTNWDTIIEPFLTNGLQTALDNFSTLLQQGGDLAKIKLADGAGNAADTMGAIWQSKSFTILEKLALLWQSKSVDLFSKVMNSVGLLFSSPGSGALTGAAAGAGAGLLVGGPVGALIGAGIGAIGGGIVGGVAQNAGGTAPSIQDILGIVGSFAGGGVVPGAFGSPQLVLAHGGEPILTPQQYANLTGPTIHTTVQVFLGEDEVSDFVIDRIQHRAFLATGDKRTAAALTGRAR